MYHAGAALVGWLQLGQIQVGGPLGEQLKLVCARGLGLPEAAGQLECPDAAPVCAVGVGGRCKQWCLEAPLTQREFQQFPHSVDTLELVNGFPSLLVSSPLKLPLLSCVPGQANMHAGPSGLSLPTVVFSIRAGVSIVTVPCLSCHSVRSLHPLLCRSCSISSQFFFRRNCSPCRYRFSVSMGGSEFRILLHCHLEAKLLFLLNLVSRFESWHVAIVH